VCNSCCCFPLCCFSYPDYTIEKAVTYCKKRDWIGPDNKPIVSYKLTHTGNNDGFKAVEIFRNAEAVNLYHSEVPFKMGFFDCCEMFKLIFTQKFIEINAVYGDPAECAKTNVGRVKSAEKKGHLTKWESIPSQRELTDRFGKFHYGWEEKESAAETEAPPVEQKMETEAPPVQQKME